MVVVANHQAAPCLPVVGVARPCYLEFFLCFPYNLQSFTSHSGNFSPSQSLTPGLRLCSTLVTFTACIKLHCSSVVWFKSVLQKTAATKAVMAKYIY